MRVLIICFVVLIAAMSLAEEPAVAVHYKKACLLRDQGNFSAAIEEVAKGIALNPLEKDWLAKSELLSADLYVELGMLNSAKVTARQVEMLYPGTEFATGAKTLSEKIKQLTEVSGEPE